METQLQRGLGADLNVSSQLAHLAHLELFKAALLAHDRQLYTFQILPGAHLHTWLFRTFQSDLLSACGLSCTCLACK